MTPHRATAVTTSPGPVGLASSSYTTGRATEVSSGYNGFQYEIYLSGVAGEVPTLPMTYEGMRERAFEVLPPESYGYVAGSASAESTERANRRAFERWRLRPRMLRDVSERDLGVDLLGRRLPAPLLLAPIGVQGILHDEAEVATARGAASLGIPTVLSTVSSYSIEDVAEAAGDTPRWFQLYWPTEDAITDSLVQRAADAGYDAVVVTLDTKMLAWRPRDLHAAFLPFLHGRGLANYRTDPAFQAGIPEDAEDVEQATVMRWAQVFADPSQTGEELKALVERSPLPVLVKGIQHPADARLAVEAGVAGLVVSNHGGRQVDGAIGSLEALPEVAEAVGDEVPVLFDSGVRTGGDLAIALALGADAVLLGRPYAWGLAVAGDEGVRHVLRCILADFELTMALSGATTCAELDRDLLVRDA
jgi:lactate 2-monooxygenase